MVFLVLEPKSFGERTQKAMAMIVEKTPNIAHNKASEIFLSGGGFIILLLARAGLKTFNQIGDQSFNL